jgi:hypothetical protein
MLPVCAIIPIHTSQLAKAGLLFDMVSYLRESMRVVIAVNGPPIPGMLIPCVGGNAHGFYAGDESNPYIARNRAVRFVLDGLPEKPAGYFFTDADCLPTAGLSWAVAACASNSDTIIAGRVTTATPAGTRHFNAIKGLECYDGFLGEGGVYGASMYVPAPVMAALGGFVETSVSRGDDELAARWRAQGGKFRYDPTMHVRKWIHGMTLQGICEKQLRRGRSACAARRPSEDAALDDLQDALNRAREALSRRGDSGFYRDLVDNIFRIQYDLGVLQQYYDVPESPKHHHSDNA